MTQDASDKLLHITIGAFNPNPFVSPGKLNLEREIEMTKAALLYGDRAHLCSIAGTLALTFVKFSEDTARSPQQKKWDTIYNLIDDQIHPTSKAALDEYRRLCRRRHKGPIEYGQIRQLEEIINQATEKLVELAHAQAEDSRFSELKCAQDAGLLQIDIVEEFSVTDLKRGDMQLSELFVKRVTEAIEGSVSYPLFDSPVASLVQLGILTGDLKPSDRFEARGRQAQLAASLFDRLPNFDLANMSEILDIRRELQTPLVRFRSAVINISADIKAAPWTNDFEHDVEQVFRKQVEPAVAEIEGAIRSNSYLRGLVSRFAADADKIASASAKFAALPSGLSIFAADHRTFLWAISAIAGLTPAVMNALDVHLQVQQKKDEARKNQLFFYYETKRRLRDR